MRMCSAHPLVVVGALLAAVTAEAAPDPAGGCYALEARSTGKLLSHNGRVPFYNANRDTMSAWERFCVVPVADGDYLLQGEDRLYVSSRPGGVVQKAVVPDAFERWRITRDAGGALGLRSRAHDGWLSADGTLDGIVTTKSAYDAWEKWDLVPTEGCVCAVASEPDLNTTAEPAPRSGPIFGFADTHSHPFANHGFGGTVLEGDVSSPLGIQGALHACTYEHGKASRADLLGLVLNHELHDNEGAPGFSGWPAHDNVNHQQMYHGWMERAWRGGQRLQVMLAVSNELICHITKATTGLAYAASVGQLLTGVHPPPPPDLSWSCDDMDSIRRQVDAAKAFEAWLDARSGGPGTGWYRIVYTPDEARRVAESGKMAVVLGAEVDTLFGCSAAAPCERGQVERQIDELYGMGVRHIFPVHVLDNAFAGAAQYNQIFVGANIAKNADTFRIVNCDDAALVGRFGWVQGLGEVCEVFERLPPELLALMPPSLAAAREGLKIACASRPPPGVELPASGGHCNARGLTADGEWLLNRLMDKGMVIDTDHMSARALEATLAIAERRGYPLVSGHTGLVDRVPTPNESAMSGRDVERFRRLGGLVAPILHTGHALAEVKPYGDKVPHACAGSTTSWAQNYLYLVDRMGGPDTAAVPFGSDMNGLISLPAPRFGEHACHGDKTAANPAKQVAYPFTGFGQSGTFGKMTTGTRSYDYNTDGLANVGLVPDFIQDLRNVGIDDRHLGPLFRSAEAYLKLWKTSTERPVAYTRVPLSTRESMSWHNAVAVCAAQGKRLANREEVCLEGPEGMPSLGTPPGDVWMAVGDAENGWISVGEKYPERRCRMHRQTYGTAPGWGLDRGPEPVTGQPAAVLCVDYTLITRGSGVANRDRFTWSDAAGHCEAQGMRLASRGELCPAGPEGEPKYGRLAGDVWLAVSDHSNAWLSVGELYADLRKCKLHREFYGQAPGWGMSTGWHASAVVCVPR